MNLYLDKILWLLLAIACAPSLVDHVRRLWNFEQYHYLPALALAVGFLINARWNRKLDTQFGWFGWTLLAFGMLFLSVGVGLYSGWLGTLGFVFLLGAWFESHRESKGGSLLSIWPLSWLILSLPLGFDDALTNWLQLKSTRLSSFFLDLVDIPHAQFGNVIELAKGKLFVEQACSGVQSLYTLIFVAFLIVVVLRRPPILLPLYFLAAVFWAGLMNVVRIFTIAYASSRMSMDLAHGWQHEVLGYTCLTLAILLLLSTDRLIRVLFFPVEARDSATPESNPLVYVWNRRMSETGETSATAERSVPSIVVVAVPSIIAGLLCLGASLQFVGSFLRSGPATISVAEKEPFLALPEKLAMLGIEGFEQTSYERIRGDVNLPFGENADVWRGTYQGIPLTLAVNQPYSVWHDLCLCYQGNGLQLNSKETISDAGWNYVDARLLNESGGVTYLLFSGLDSRGNEVNAPTGDFLSSLWVRLRSGELEQYNSPQGELALVQLVYESDEFALPETAAILTEIFKKVRTVILNECQKRAPTQG
ncbi:MAG: exosortase U [Pirellulaceae bacterium]|nr:exosortase U [Pirellulaceae bacterium]